MVNKAFNVTELRRSDYLRKILRLIVAFVVLIPRPALADGNELLQRCAAAEQFLDNPSSRTGADDLALGYCVGLIEGVRNTWVFLDSNLPRESRICLPANGITNGQAVRVVVKYLRENPAKLHMNQVTLTALAFLDAYKCSSE